MEQRTPSVDLPERLRGEIRHLGRLLGRVIAEEAGERTYHLVEELRRAAVAARRDGADRSPIDELVAELDVETAEDVAKEMGHNAVAELCAVSPRKGYGTTCLMDSNSLGRFAARIIADTLVAVCVRACRRKRMEYQAEPKPEPKPEE